MGLPAGRRPARDGAETLIPRWVPYLFAALSLVLTAGIVRVFGSAPPLHLAVHWRLAWGGFDLGLAGLLAVTGLALLRRSALAEVLAAMTATLLCSDAWLDVLSSVGQGPGSSVVAIAEAAFAELPLAALFGWVAVRFARAVSDAAPSLRLAGFRIRHRRLLPPPGGYPGQLDAESALGQRRWRQWTPLGHSEQPGLLLPWWLPAVCLGLVIVLLPWTGWLFATLPRTELAGHWGLARAGEISPSRSCSRPARLPCFAAGRSPRCWSRWPRPCCCGTPGSMSSPPGAGMLVTRSALRPCLSCRWPGCACGLPSCTPARSRSPGHMCDHYACRLPAGGPVLSASDEAGNDGQTGNTASPLLPGYACAAREPEYLLLIPRRSRTRSRRPESGRRPRSPRSS